MRLIMHKVLENDMKYYNKISENNVGMFESKEKQKTAFGVLESGPFFEIIEFLKKRTKISLVSKFFCQEKEKIEGKELRKFYENREIKCLFSKDLERAKKFGEENKKNDELKILKGINDQIFKLLEKQDVSKYKELNSQYGRDSTISYKKILDAVAALNIPDENFEETWECCREMTINAGLLNKIKFPDSNSSVFEKMIWFSIFKHKIESGHKSPEEAMAALMQIA